jgi:hypothetical protein
MPEKAIRVKVVDAQDRTRCVFRKTTHFDSQLQPEHNEPWTAEAKPMSEKSLELTVQTSEARLAKPPVRTIDGQRYLELPGLTLKWTKVVAVLDKLSAGLNLVDKSGAVLKDDMDSVTLTIAQLRQFAQRL